MSGIEAIGKNMTAIGKSNSSPNAFDGIIDNVFFFDEILSPAQLTAIRDGGQQAILATSVPEPPTASLLVFGLLARQVSPRWRSS